MLGYATVARRQGVTLVPHCAATGIDVRDGHVVAVRTEGGTIRTDTVICAAGAWSARVGSWVGVDLPVTPLRRQILVTDPMPGLAADPPFTIDFDTNFYFHAEGKGLLLGMSDPDENPVSRSPGPTRGCRASGRPSSGGHPRSPTSASPAAGPGCTR